MTESQDRAIRKRRRVNGEGSVYKRKDGYWAGAFDVPTTSGARKRIVVYGIPLLCTFLCFGRPLRFGLAVALLLLAHSLQGAGVTRSGLYSGPRGKQELVAYVENSVLDADRSYFGVLRVHESLRGEPLREEMELDFASVGVRKFRHFGAARIAQGFGNPGCAQCLTDSSAMQRRRAVGEIVVDHG